MAVRKTESSGLDVPDSFKFRRNVRNYYILGISPIIFNSMSAKTQQGLLIPPPKKTAADKKVMNKHNPVEEFRNSVYTIRDPEAPTLIGFPGSAIRAAIGNAALDVPGLKKTEIQRLTWVEESTIGIYGIPLLRMDVVRTADMAHTPDIRTRAIMETWCAQITVCHDGSLVTGGAVDELIFRAGQTIGIGDFRQQKGAGSYGRFIPIAHDDPKVVKLMAQCGRQAQQEALDEPLTYDNHSQSLLTYWEQETSRRFGAGVVKPAKEKVKS